MRVEPLWMELVPVIKEASESPLAPSGKDTQRLCQQWTRKVVSQEGDDTDTLVVDIQPSELRAIDIYCFSHPGCGTFLHSPSGLDKDFSSTNTLFFFNFYFILLYNTILVLPSIDMNQPRMYMSSPSWTTLPPPTPYYLPGSSPCTSPKHSVSCIKHRLAIRFLHNTF